MRGTALESYTERARQALRDQVLQSALADVQRRLGQGTAALYRQLPEGPDLRHRAHDIRMNAVENLDVLLETLVDKIRSRGGKVFFARDGDAAVTYCLEVARKHQVKLVTKGKSMVSEEIGLNAGLQAAGIEVVETDLGEYIIQLAGEKPSHIVAPAIHKTREQVAKLFVEKLGISYTESPPELTWAARKALRGKFLAADMGISGCNLACAETGHITTVSNEGNIRMVTTMPRVHVAVMGMERIVTTLEDHDVLLRLLSYGAAAQRLAGYITYVGGPAESNHADGPDEFHLVIVDNGRTRILSDARFREVLGCIRCGACLNVCPVYGKIGGHSYGFPYSGPIGAVVTPLLFGISKHKDLCQGETLCGACKEACPVALDIPRLLLELRARIAQGDPQWGIDRPDIKETVSYGLWSLIIRNRRLYEAVLRLATAGQRFLPKRNGMISHLPFPFEGWSMSRDMRPLARKTFVGNRRRFREGR